MELITELIGYAAATFGTALMLPQVYKMIKTKKVSDLSLSMLYVYLINCILWEIYGLLIWSMPMILCNAIASCIGVLQLVLKYRYAKLTV